MEFLTMRFLYTPTPATVRVERDLTPPPPEWPYMIDDYDITSAEAFLGD